MKLLVISALLLACATPAILTPADPMCNAFSFACDVIGRPPSERTTRERDHER